MRFRLLSAVGESALSLWSVAGPERSLVALLGASLPPQDCPRLRVLPCAQGGVLDQALVWRRPSTQADPCVEVHLHGGFGVAQLFRQSLHALGFLLEEDPSGWGAKGSGVLGEGSLQARWRWDRAGPEVAPFLQPPLVVLAGPANAGKSTLFNAWVGSERVTVSPHPGTTRDAVEASVLLPVGEEDLEIRLVDTAGFGAGTGQELDRQSWEIATARIEEAWCVIWVLDAAKAPSEDLLRTMDARQGPALRLIQRMDLGLSWEACFPALRGSVHEEGTAVVQRLENALTQTKKLASFAGSRGSH